MALLAAISLICVLSCLGAPALGSFHHEPSAVAVPVGVPVPVPVPVPSPYPVPSPVAVPAPVAVPVSDTVTVPAAFSAHQGLTYGAVDHYGPPPPAIFKYAASYAAPQPVIKYSLGAPVTTTTTTYTGFAAAPPPSVHYAAAAPPPPQFIARFAPPPIGYQFAAAAPSYGRYKLHFGSPPHHSPAVVYGAPPPPAFGTQGW
ncbi:leucine-rich repeat extensin-like protein 3 [Drosophila santomea]|uniref:leucine-rich repeat extensin-like protein 3 n=1 Tax=Drosophila santomea TaxID=129105 RepID=UPI0019546641|nr:leucine-rich repeat extensin-like protein 3 [Drosophila santomea]